MAGSYFEPVEVFDTALALTVDESLRRHLAARRDAMRLASGGGSET